MKKIYLFLSFISILCVKASKAQTILCSEMCVLNITIDTVGANELNVSIFNGTSGSQINYPVVNVTDSNGDTIGNILGQFYYFAQIAGDTLVHSIPTNLNSLATNFTGTVYIKDTPTGTVCSYAFPMTCTVGISEYTQNNFSIYPNPATTDFTIDLSNFNLSETSIIIYDFSGKLIQQVETTESKTIINTENLNTGIYFISVASGQKLFNQKIIIAR